MSKSKSKLKRGQSGDGETNNIETTSSARSSGGRGSDDGVSDTLSSGRRLIIKPLSTVGDRGIPSKSVSKDLRRVVNFIEDERHLVAHELYLDAKERWEKMIIEKRKLDDTIAAGKEQRGKEPREKRSWLSGKHKTPEKPVFDEKEFTAAFEIVKKHKEDFNLLMKRAPLLLQCRDNMDETDGWTLAQTLFGITTFYRREDDGTLSIKLEGELKGIPLFEQVAVFREIDLHSFWAPFVTSSMTVSHLDKLDQVGWFIVGLPNFGIARDCVVRAIGCDCVAEDESVLLVGRGVQDLPPGVPAPNDEGAFLSQDPVLDTLEIPPWPTRMGAGRMTMHKFEAKIKVLGPDHCHTYLLANLDPNLAFIPQPMLEFVMKKCCGFLLLKLQGAAKKITKDPVRNVHAQRLRDEAAFYRDWLLPKFRTVAADRGWEMPTISAFDLTESQQVEVDKLNSRRTKKMHSFSHFEAGDSDDALEKAGSTRSEPELYHSPGLDNNDDDSDISSLSGTSQSIWKNNPISTYLREVETKVQKRKDKAVEEARRKAATRLRPRPFPVEKQDRLAELKTYKQRKLRSRGASSDSLPPVDEDDGNTVVTSGRSVVFSPVTAVLKGQGLWQRFWVMSFMIFVMTLLLHLDKYLPSFDGLGNDMLASFLRNLAVVLFMCLCGAAHFTVCDALLIYTFEAFELGMKSGDLVKRFYRGQVRFMTGVTSGLLVLTSIVKAVSLASTKRAVAAIVNYHTTSANNVEEGGNESEATISSDVNQTIGSVIPDYVVQGYASIVSLVAHGYAVVLKLMDLSRAMFDWEMETLVRSNWLGRSFENIVTGAYDAWMGALSGFFSRLSSFASNDDSLGNAQCSWREDATFTLRHVLLYTICFLWMVLLLLNTWARSYRYSDADPDAASVTATSSNSESEQESSRMVSPTPSRDASSKRSKDSSSKKLLKFRRKKSKPDDDSL